MFGGPVTRRHLLAWASSVATGDALGVRSSRSGASNDTGQSENVPAWEKRADERISKHRTTGLVVKVTDGNGNPLPGATVDIHMRRHGFDFGTAVDAEYLVEESAEGGKYRTNLTNLFNKAVLENRHKWAFWERESDRRLANEATQWLLRHGLEMRGHTCIWQRPDQGAIPDDVVAAIESADEERLRRRSNEHVTDIVGHYRNTSSFTEWDVLNEQVEYHAITDIIDPFEGVEAPTLIDWFRRAKEADPEAQLFLNEYNILAGHDQHQRNAYERLIGFLQERNAGLGGIGMQSHHSSTSQRRSPSGLVRTLDRFAAFGVPIQISEYDTWGPEWTEKTEAEYLYRFLKTAFSHPAVEGFLMWGFWDGEHWKDNAPLFRSDWSPKPALDRYRRLVFDQWWTVETGRTRTGGTYETTGFLGAYDITASKGRRSRTVNVTLSDPRSRKAVEIRLE